MNIKKSHIVLGWLSLCLSALLASTLYAASNYGVPGEEFTRIHYPQEMSWQVESNPAFLPAIDRKSFHGGLFPGFESSYLTSAELFIPVRTTLGFPDNRNGTAAAALMVRNVGAGDIEGRGVNNEPLGTFSDSKTLISILYGQKFLPSLSIGVGFKFINYSTSKITGSALEGLSKSAFGTDFGVFFEPTENVDIGLSFANAPLQPNITLIEEEEKWPMTVHFDVGLHVLDQRLLLTAGTDYIRNEQGGESDDIIRPEVGVDFRIHDKLTIGVGYAYDQPIGGARFEFPGLTFQYSVENSDLGILHHASVGFAFGSTGDERYLALARELPDKLFAEALRLFNLGRYYKAADKFALFYNRYPEDQRTDQALSYIAKSFEGFEARAGAVHFYRKLVQERPRSKLCAAALADIVRLRYEAGDHRGVEESFRELQERYPSSQATGDSRYYIGMVKLQEGDHEQGANYLSAVPSSSGNYLFAQYGLGLCYLNDPKKSAVLGLQQAIGAFTNALAEREKLTTDEEVLRDRSALVIGHLLREKGELGRAIAKYADVGGGVFKWEAAIAAAYCHYDLGEFETAIRVVDSVINNHTGDSYFAEAMLVKQECLQSMNRPAEAESVRSRLHKMLATVAVVGDKPHQETMTDLRAKVGTCLSQTQSGVMSYARSVEQNTTDGKSSETLSLRQDLIAAKKRLETARDQLTEYVQQTNEQRKLSTIRDALVLTSP